MWKNKTILFFLSVTFDCNLDCPWCYVRRGDDQKLLGPIEDVVITALYDLFKKEQPANLFLPLTGGEPLLYPDVVVRINKLFASLPFFERVRVFTNGVLLDKSLIDYLISNGIQYFSVSVGKREDIDEQILSIFPYLFRRVSSVHVLCDVTAANLGRIEEIVRSVLSLLPESFKIRIRPIINDQWDDDALDRYQQTMPKLSQLLGEWSLQTGRIWHDEKFRLPGSFGDFYCNVYGDKSPMACAPSGDLFPCPRLVGFDVESGSVSLFGSLGNVMDWKGISKKGIEELDTLLQEVPCSACPRRRAVLYHEICPLTFVSLSKKIGYSKAKTILCSIHTGYLRFIKTYLEIVYKSDRGHLRNTNCFVKCGQYDYTPDWELLRSKILLHTEG